MPMNTMRANEAHGEPQAAAGAALALGARPGGPSAGRFGGPGCRPVCEGGPEPAYACCADTGDEFWYNVGADGCACIVRCASRSKRLCIPETLDGFAVSELAPESFCNLACAREVVCPKNLRRIGERAFAGCASLRGLSLNEGLESIGNEAFSLCAALGDVLLPSSLKRVGSSLARQYRHLANCSGGAVSIAPASSGTSGVANIVIDEAGIIYERSGDGLALVDGSRFSGASLDVPEGTVAIGAHALSRNADLQRVTLPEGVVSIGESAFRGCTRLARVDVPETLEEIGAGAFSCTAIESIYLPKRCTRVHEEALTTGPVFPGSAGSAYSSSLREIRVHPENPVFRLRGQVLCRRVGDGNRLEAVLAPRSVELADLTGDVCSVGRTAFAGAVAIRLLRVDERVAFPEGFPLAPNGGCDRIEIELAESRDGRTEVGVDLPDGAACAAVLESALKGGRVDVEGMLAAYDEALGGVGDAPKRLRMMAARLAAPVHLSERIARSFSDAVRAALRDVCDYFGARNDWGVLDSLLDAGLLDESNISRIAGRLSAHGSALAAGYLLDAKRARFGKACFDYGI